MALVVYTGDLASTDSKQIMQAFLETQCQAMVEQRKGGNSARGAHSSRAGSSASSVKSGSAAGSSSLNSQFEYIKAILGNVFTFGGHRHFLRFLKRTGKSKLSLQKVIKRLQKSFAPEEWYYYRKIHKKERNYFLNKGGQRGESGGGWVAFDTKMSKSTTSKVSSGGISSVEESKSGVVILRKKASNSLRGVK